MSAMLSAVRRRNDVVELMMVTIYVVLTAYLFVCNCPPRIAFVLRDAVAPFQIKARARRAMRAVPRRPRESSGPEPPGHRLSRPLAIRILHRDIKPANILVAKNGYA